MGWLTDSGFKRQKKKQSDHNNLLIKARLRSPPNPHLLPSPTPLSTQTCPPPPLAIACLGPHVCCSSLPNRSSLSTTLIMLSVYPPFALFSQILVSAPPFCPQARINAARSKAHCSPPVPHTVYRRLKPACSRLFHVVYLMYTIRSWFVGPSVNPWIGLVRQSKKTRNLPSYTLVRPRCSPRALPR